MGKIAYSAKLFQEFVAFARARRVYWIVPLALLLGAASLLVVATQAVTPVLYTLF